MTVNVLNLGALRLGDHYRKRGVEEHRARVTARQARLGGLKGGSAFWVAFLVVFTTGGERAHESLGPLGTCEVQRVGSSVHEKE